MPTIFSVDHILIASIATKTRTCEICSEKKRVLTTRHAHFSTSLLSQLLYYFQFTDNEKISRTIEDLCLLRHKRLAPIYGYHWKIDNELMVFRAHVPQGTVADLVKRSSLPQVSTLERICNHNRWICRKQRFDILYM